MACNLIYELCTCYAIKAQYTEPSIIEILNDIDSYLWFITQVNSEAPWDVKESNSWKLIFPDLPVPEPKEEFMFRGLKITSEDLGNILYGYLGTAMGMNEKVLYAAGGVAKELKHVSLSNMEDAFKVLDSFVNNYNDEKNNFGDDANDHINIQKGIKMYYNDYVK